MGINSLKLKQTYVGGGRVHVKRTGRNKGGVKNWTF